jgi:tetratricopeptide (TPR) repeat protein
LEREPKTADDYVVRARTLNGRNYPEAAVEDYRKALELEPRNDMFLYEMADTLWGSLHNGEEALPYVELLMDIGGSNQSEASILHEQILAEKRNAKSAT